MLLLRGEDTQNCLINGSVSKVVLIWISCASIIIAFRKTWTENENIKGKGKGEVAKKRKAVVYSIYYFAKTLEVLLSLTCIVRT